MSALSDFIAKEPDLRRNIWVLYLRDQVIPVAPASYIVYREHNKVFAKNGQTGAIEYSSDDAYSVLKYCKDQLKAKGGGVIFVKAGTYSLSSTFPDEDVSDIIMVVGEGSATKLVSPSGVDALDYTKIRFRDISWTDRSGNQWDSTFDPNIFRSILSEELAPLNTKYSVRFESMFKLYGYRGRQRTRPRPTYDINSVKKIDGYYVMIHVNYYASPPTRLLSVMDANGNIIAEKDIGTTPTFDIDEANWRVVYFNKNTGYVEEASLPRLDRVVQLFPLSYDHACVKYHPDYDYIVVAPRRTSGSVEIRDRSGNVVDSLPVSETIWDVAIDSETIVVASTDADGLTTIRAYSKGDKSLYGVLEKFSDRLWSVDFRTPFILIGNQDSSPLVLEQGGYPFGAVPVPSNSLWYDDEVLVGTMWFSIFEVPMNFRGIEPIKLGHYRTLTVPANSNKRVSIMTHYGANFCIFSNVSVNVDAQIPRYINPFGYVRVYGDGTYRTIKSYSGTTICDSLQYPFWMSLLIKNTSSSGATIEIIGWGI